MVLCGIGTATYFEPEFNKFAMLGHGIIDVDTEELVSVGTGEVVTASVSEIVRGLPNAPGEIRGSIRNSRVIGALHMNTHFGMYGILSDYEEINVVDNSLLEVASRDQIEAGRAAIILNIEDGERQEYEIEIVRIHRNNNSDNKSMLIQITDERLLRTNRRNCTRNERGTNNSKRQIYTEL